MKPFARNASLSWLAVSLLGAAALALWVPALWTPFWGDDYVFLHGAHAANASGAPWWSDFLPASPVRFWRPLSQEAYWRFVDAVLHGDAFAAHGVNLALHALASLGVALLAHRVAHACAWAGPGRVAALAGAAYAALTMHLLPVHWVAAANTALLTLFTTLALAAWISARDVRGTGRAALLASVPVLLALALLCKESAALTPGLMIVDTPRAPAIAALLVLSSSIAVEGTRRLDHPGLIGRARWAEATLQALERQPPPALPLHVSVADEQRFYAIGAWGLAWRLDVPLQRIGIARQCPATGPCLVIDDQGAVRWRDAH